jgi:hypothetical protein
MSEAAFTLDTSGAVDDPHGWGLLYWSDLTPFAQGYVEALFASLATPPFTGHPHLQREGVCYGETIVGFSDLAPETLAAILKDCASFANIAEGLGAKAGAVEGRRFWGGRQRRFPGVGNPAWTTAFPPLTPYLDDDGRVYLR